nr:zinc knuckle CX2CX4HX4C [Tanacetum cinerariifolium]
NRLEARHTESLALLLEEMGSVDLGPGPDTCIWSLDSGGLFCVDVTRRYIDAQLLSMLPNSTRWSTTLPRKWLNWCDSIGMEQGFLSHKGSGVGRGVKEKNLNWNKKNTSSTIGVSTDSDDTMNDDTPVGVASGVTLSVVDMTVEMEKQNSLDDTTVSESFPPERFANTTYGFFLGKKVAYPVVANYVRNTWDKYGLVRSMFSSSTELFSFHFSSMDGLDVMLVNRLGIVVYAGGEWWRSWGVVGEVENGWESGEKGLVMLAGKTGEVTVGLNVGKK